MDVRAALRNLAADVVGLGAARSDQVLRDRRNVDIILGAVLGDAGALAGIQYPVAYAEFLRSCLEQRAFAVKEVRADTAPPDGPANRVATLLDALANGVPTIPLPTAIEIGRIADRMSGLSEPMDHDRWSGDVGLHFMISSSFARKGRLLSAVVRFTRSERCVELGTAYGMSALFILAAFNASGRAGHLTTIEGWDPQFSLARETLRGRHRDAVTCEKGRASDVLPKLAASLRNVDLLFHDAGHLGKDYIDDFEASLPMMGAGSIVLVDDIRWADARFTTGPTGAYEGWRAIVAHPRVRRAVEIDASVGVLHLT
jgi:predicted O-methyltransferase YrrM